MTNAINPAAYCRDEQCRLLGTCQAAPFPCSADMSDDEAIAVMDRTLAEARSKRTTRIGTVPRKSDPAMTTPTRSAGVAGGVPGELVELSQKATQGEWEVSGPAHEGELSISAPEGHWHAFARFVVEMSPDSRARPDGAINPQFAVACVNHVRQQIAAAHAPPASGVDAGAEIEKLLDAYGIVMMSEAYAAQDPDAAVLARATARALKVRTTLLTAIRTALATRPAADRPDGTAGVREAKSAKLTMPNGDVLECDYPHMKNWARSWTIRAPDGGVAIGEQDWEIVEQYGLTAVLESALKRSPPDQTAEGKAVAEEDGWQPIETAPKDGTRFIALYPTGCLDQRGVVIAYWYQHPQVSGLITDEIDCNDYDFSPTHWVPMHELPALTIPHDAGRSAGREEEL